MLGVFLFIVSLELQAHSHSKDYLRSVKVEKNISVEFTLPIVEDSIKRHTVKLKKLGEHKKVDGKIFIN